MTLSHPSKLAVGVAVCAACILTALSVSAHPTDGYPTEDIRGKFGGGLSASMTHGDLVFFDMTGLESADALSSQEKYMIAGIHSSALGGSMAEWYLDIYHAVSAYYDKHGTVPDVLDADVLHDVYPGFDAARLDYYRNPLTNAWPRLNATQFSAGDLYIRPLTTEEMQWFAGQNESLRKTWYETTMMDANDLKAGVSPDKARRVKGTLVGRVYYVRVYGKTGVIKADIVCTAKSN